MPWFAENDARVMSALYCRWDGLMKVGDEIICWRSLMEWDGDGNCEIKTPVGRGEDVVEWQR